MKKRETFSAFYQKQTTLCTSPAIQGDLQMNLEMLDLDPGLVSHSICCCIQEQSCVIISSLF